MSLPTLNDISPNNPLWLLIYVCKNKLSYSATLGWNLNLEVTVTARTMAFFISGNCQYCGCLFLFSSTLLLQFDMEYGHTRVADMVTQVHLTFHILLAHREWAKVEIRIHIVSVTPGIASLMHRQKYGVVLNLYIR